MALCMKTASSLGYSCSESLEESSNGGVFALCRCVQLLKPVYFFGAAPFDVDASYLLSGNVGVGMRKCPEAGSANSIISVYFPVRTLFA